MMDFFLCFAGIFGAFIAVVGLNNAYELWCIDRTEAVLKGGAAVCMSLMVAVLLVLVKVG